MYLYDTSISYLIRCEIVKRPKNTWLGVSFLFYVDAGLHAEGSIMSNLFGLFFWDILFMDVPDVFHSAYQTHPLDLYSTQFYSNRKSAIDSQLEKIKQVTEEVCSLIDEIFDIS